MLTLGLLGMLGALSAGIADSLLLGSAASGRTFRRRQLDNLQYVSPGRLLAGHLLGLFSIPLMGFGIWQVYRALEPAGWQHALPPVLIKAYTLVLGAGAHGCFAPLGAVMQRRRVGDEWAADQGQRLVAQLKWMLYPAFVAFQLGLFVSSVWLAIVVWTQPTLYPRWMAAITPFSLFVVCSVVLDFIPRPLGGFILAAGINIGMFLFFLASTFVLT